MRKRDKFKSAEDFWTEISELNTKERYNEVTKRYIRFHKRYPFPSIKVRIAEASRISGDAATLHQTLENLDVSVIRAELGPEFGYGLLREKILQMNSFPEELNNIDSRQVLDGLGKDPLRIIRAAEVPVRHTLPRPVAHLLSNRQALRVVLNGLSSAGLVAHLL